MTPPPNMLCPLCHSSANLRYPAQPGYQAPATFAIYSCSFCGVAYVNPMEVNTTLIYDSIYRNAPRLPGYYRYVEYAKAVMSAADPLDWLASVEDTYWGVAKALGRTGNGRRVLEVGSGLGYLTYALSKAGFQARGLELSTVAVEKARSQFGDLYEVGELADVVRLRPASYDIVLFTELIEHLPKPNEFIADALRLLLPGGKLVLTTPNRSTYSDTVLWETDLPPVHLWWFSERSIVTLAIVHGCRTTFIDYSKCQIKQPPLFRMNQREGVPTRNSILDINGIPLQSLNPKWIRGLIGWLRGIHWIFMLEAELRRMTLCTGSRRPVLCAVLDPERI